VDLSEIEPGPPGIFIFEVELRRPSPPELDRDRFLPLLSKSCGTSKIRTLSVTFHLALPEPNMAS